MYLKSDQDKRQKIPTDGVGPYLWAIILAMNLTGESVSAPEWTTEGWVQRFVLPDRHSLNARCSENSVAQRGEIRC